MLKTLGCQKDTDKTGETLANLEQTFEERKEFNEVLRKYNDKDNEISPPRNESPNRPYYRKKTDPNASRPIEVPVFNEEYQDNPEWRQTLRQIEYGTREEEQHVKDLEEKYSKGKSNDFRKTGLEFDASQKSGSKDFTTPQQMRKVVSQNTDFAMTKPKNQNSNNVIPFLIYYPKKKPM